MITEGIKSPFRRTDGPGSLHAALKVRESPLTSLRVGSPNRQADAPDYSL